MIDTKEYDAYFVPALYEPWARELIKRAQVWKGDRVVDLACGTGIVACRIAGTGAHVIGIEASADRLDQAAVRAAEEAVPVTWMRKDFTATTLKPATVDLVTCQQGLQLAQDRAAVAREARRLLASGGRAVFACWRPLVEQPGFRVIDAAAVTHLGGGAAAEFSFGEPEELKQLLLAAKFMVVQLEVVNRIVRFPEPARFIAGALRSIAEDRGVTDEAAIEAAIAQATVEFAPLIIDDKLEFMTAAVIAIGRVSAK